jgi:diguanylate cyclase (GGDEF)-like protein
VNDNYGHQAGDRVLQQFADLLRHTARDIDRIGRYGGEEFIVILPSTSLREGTIFVERVRHEVEHYEFAIGRDEPITMTVSAGVATYPHEMVGSPETLVRLADEALYAAKAAGRNRVIRFDEIELEPTTSDQPG